MKIRHVFKVIEPQGNVVFNFPESGSYGWVNTCLPFEDFLACCLEAYKNAHPEISFDLALTPSGKGEDGEALSGVALLSFDVQEVGEDG